MPSQQDILSYLTSLGGNQGFAQSGANLFNQFTQPIRPDTGALQGLLQNQLAGDPNKGRYRQAFNKQLGRSSSRAIKNINEQLSGSGFRGAGANLINDVFETEAMAAENFETNLLDKDIMIKQNAIAQLLGIEGMKLGASQADRAAQMGMFGQLTGDQFQNRGLDLQERELKFREDSQPSWWEGLLGALIGGASQAGSAALIASDVRVKENIKKVGQKGDIDIVEFNYIGNPKRYRGVTAQQVEINHPEAVKQMNGIKYVDYSKLGLTMEEI